MASVPKTRFLLAVVAGLAWTVSFPKPGLAGVAWIVPGIVLASALGSSSKQSFLLGYITGIVHYLTSLYWLLYNPFPWGAAAGWLALSCYLALYPGCWAWVCVKLAPGRSARPNLPVVNEQLGAGFLGALTELTNSSWSKRSVWCIECATIWVALEMVRARLLTGFPWNLLGVSQQPVETLIQVASVTGVYGISFLVAWVSVAILCAALRLFASARELNKARMATAGVGPAGGILMVGGNSFVPRMLWLTWTAEVALPLLVVLAICAWGAGKLLHQEGQKREIRLALVQPSIPQRLVFDPLESTNRFNTIMKLTELAVETHPDVLVWPEASLPSFDLSHFQALTNLIAQHRVWMIFGADDVVPKPLPATEEYDYFNSAFLFDPSGSFVATYRKRHLVVFGEYIPFERWLPAMRYLTPVKASFTPGEQPVRFELDNPRAVTSVLICFEDVLPHLVREHVDPDTDFLLNLTNDAWFGESAAQWQHACNAAFRAVENGLPLVRCTNNGLTCWIDAFGRLRDVGFGDPNDVYAAGFKVVRVPLLDEGTRRVPTFYTQHGDVFGWVCVVLAGAALASKTFQYVGRHGRRPGNRCF